MAPRDAAKTIMDHAHQRAAAKKKWKRVRLKRWFTHTVSQAIRTTSRGEGAALGVGVAVSAGLVIASMAVTGGLSLAVIAGFAGGTYAVKRLLKSSGKRLNRNWLKNYGKAYSYDSKNYASALGTASRDAIRRSIDHYIITKTILKNELRPLKDVKFTTCEVAITYTKAVCRFIHHSDKTRNYLLPCVDVIVFMAMQHRAEDIPLNVLEPWWIIVLVAWRAHGMCVLRIVFHMHLHPLLHPNRPFSAGWPVT